MSEWVDQCAPMLNVHDAITSLDKKFTAESCNWLSPCLQLGRSSPVNYPVHMHAYGRKFTSELSCAHDRGKSSPVNCRQTITESGCHYACADSPLNCPKHLHSNGFWRERGQCSVEPQKWAACCLACFVPKSALHVPHLRLSWPGIKEPTVFMKLKLEINKLKAFCL